MRAREIRMVYLIVSSCSKMKDDSVPIPSGAKTLDLSDYLDDLYLINRIVETRERIFQDSRAQVGGRETYAFDLYVRAGKAYSKIYWHHYQQLKSLLLQENRLSWFFLSGGYGIVNALEKARKYQATFNRDIAYKNRIPYTTPLWKPILTDACNAIFRKINPEYIYVFGSRDYTQFIKETERWKRRDRIKIFESYGSPGPNWISQKLCELIESLMNGNISEFNRRCRSNFISQQFLR